MSSRRKVMLITPPYHSGVVESAGTWLNVAFVYIAGSLRASGYEVMYYDAMSYFHNYGDIQKRIEDFRPDVVASTAYTASICDAIKVLELAKKVNELTVTVIGNVHATFMWDEVLNDPSGAVDYVIRGEGEITLPELLDCHFAGGDPAKVKGIAYKREGVVVATPSREFITGLDSLPMAWDLVDWKIYSYRPVPDSVLAIISTSRGCNQHCSFCSQQLFWGGCWRPRSAESVVAEMEFLNRQYGVNVIMLADETPTLGRERWLRILELIRERGLALEILMETRVSDIIRDEDILPAYKASGVSHIYVGVETVSEAVLNTFRKDMRIEDSQRAINLINRHDIVSETSFVLGMPDETPENIARTLELAKHYSPDLGFFLAIAPWPYADLYETLEPHIATKDYRKYNLVEPVVKPVAMTLDELQQQLLKATRLFYMDKLQKLDSMSPSKQKFMLAVMKLMMEHSYLAGEIKGAIPPEMRQQIETLGRIAPIP